MAGIGFVLKKLANKDDLFGVVRAYTHAALAAAGPWLFTVVALGSITLLFQDFFADKQLVNFRVVIVYNFSFSLVIAASIYMVITRYLADTIHAHDVTQTPSVLIGSLFWLYGLVSIFLLPWYLFYFNLSLSAKLASIANLYLISTVWLLAVFLTALKDYHAISKAFFIGMILAVLFSDLFKDPYKDVGMINGFSLGLAYIVFVLIAKILSEYNYKFGNPFDMKPFFHKYWELIWGGVFYNIAIGIDKWIMWYFAPESIGLESKMRQYPGYDSGMFLAYLTVIPSIAMFVFSVETNFFIKYKKFYYDILEHAPFYKIRENHKHIITSIHESARNFMIVQGTLTFLVIILAPKLFEWLNISYMQIGIFKLGALGAFFHVLALFGMIILSYFDNRRMIMWQQFLFMVTNAVFTFITIDPRFGLGFQYYGFGYFLSCLVTFLVTAFYLFGHINRLPYHAFVTRNNSITYQKG